MLGLPDGAMGRIALPLEWLGKEDSNPHIRIQNPLSYR